MWTYNHYKCITCVCSYFTKDETECSQAIMNAAKEARADKMTIADGLRKMGAAFLSTREVSSQEWLTTCQNYGSEKSSQELYCQY